MMTSHGIFVVNSAIYKNSNSLPLKSANEEHAENLTNAIQQLLSVSPDIVIIAKDGTVMFNRTLLAMYSPILKGALSDMNCCGDFSTILLPDCSIEAIQALLQLIKCGFSSCVYLSFREYTHILEAAKLLQIDLNFQNVQGTQNEKISFQNASSSRELVKALTSNIVDKQLKADASLDKSSQNLVGNIGKPVASPKPCIQKNIKKKKIIVPDQESVTNGKAKKTRLERISGRDNDNKREKIRTGLAESYSKTPIETIWREFFQNPKMSKEKCKALTEELGFTREDLRNIKRSRMRANSEKMSLKDTSKNYDYKNISNIDKSSSKISCILKKKIKRQILTNENENTQNADSRKENNRTSKKCKKSAYQFSYLRKEFNNNQTISIERAQLLSKELFLTEKQIRDWFKHQRSKLTNTKQDDQSKIKSKMIKSMDKIEQDNGKIIDKFQEEKGKLFYKVEQELQEKIERQTELVRESNNNAKSQSCSLCSLSFLNISHLRCRSSVHSNLKERGDADSKQAKVSKTEDAETREINHEEINERKEANGSYLEQYNCNYCESSFESKLLLKFHKNEDCIAKSFQDEISFMKQKLEALVQK